MMYSIWRLLIGGLIVLSAVGATLAQDDDSDSTVGPDTFFFADGTTLEMPDGWRGEMFEGLVSLLDFPQQELNIIVVNTDLVAWLAVEPGDSLIDVMEADFNFAYSYNEDLTFDRDGAFDEFEVDEREAARYVFEESGVPGLMLGVRLDDGKIMLVYSYNLADETFPDEITALDVLESLEAHDPETVYNDAIATVDLTESYLLDSGAIFEYPAGWDIDIRAEGGVVLTRGTSAMLIPDTRQLEFIGVTPDMDTPTLIETVWNEINRAGTAYTFEDGIFRAVELAGREITRYDFYGEDGTLTIYVIPFSDGTRGVLAASTASDMLPPEADFLATVASFDRE